MELSIKPCPSNSYPTGGVLVRGHSLAIWLQAIQTMGLTLEQVKVYPLPGTAANTVWGCLLELPKNAIPKEIGQHTYCQLAHQQFFIPTNAIVYPTLQTQEIEQLFGDERYCYHPVIGWAPLTTPFDFSNYVVLPNEQAMTIRQPAATVYVPNSIKSFQVHQPPPEQVLDKMDNTLFPEKKVMEDKPLNLLEKIKLGMLRSLFSPKGEKKKYSSAEGGKQKPWLEKITNLFGGKQLDAFASRLQNQYEDLEQRNQKVMDKLLDMFKNNPDEALKYAIPIDNDGTSRGGRNQAADLSKRWGNFSLFGSSAGSGSGSITLGDSYLHSLYKQYHHTANELKKKKEYAKAAFVYLKLLKEPQLAAEALREGGMYGEAAAIYIKHCNNMQAAADCYESGRMTLQAIDLYKQLGKDEKVGDLYLTLNDEKNAYYYFKKVTDTYENSSQYVRAALLYKHKMQDTEKAQELLLKGWREMADATNCLNNYFSNIDEEAALLKAINRIYKDETTATSEVVFLRVLQNQYGRGTNAADCTRDIAYEIIARHAADSPDIVSELKYFNQLDKNLIKDVLKYKQGRKKRP